MSTPEIIKQRAMGMQLCVPEDWSQDDILRFAEKEAPCGTTNGWFLCDDGHPSLGDSPARVPCAQQDGFVHVVVVA